MPATLSPQLKIIPLPYALTVAKLPPDARPALPRDFACLTRTARELSLICRTEDVPEETLTREDGWRGFFIEGTLDFALVGILAKITGLLAAEGIAIFALSTYDTDYVLVQEADFEPALAALARQGYAIGR